MAVRSGGTRSDHELAGEYREALARAANAAREAALLSHLLQSRGIGALKGEEPAQVDALLLDAGRQSLQARTEAAVFA